MFTKEEWNPLNVGSIRPRASKLGLQACGLRRLAAAVCCPSLLGHAPRRSLLRKLRSRTWSYNRSSIDIRKIPL